MAIEARHYQETRERLQADPVVVAMAAQLPSFDYMTERGFVHEDGTPRFSFMQTANREYRAHSGTDGGHIGAVAEAIIALVKASTICPRCHGTGRV